MHTADRVMTTVLFTDIVDSTAAQQRIGDEAWRTLRKSFEANSRRLVEQFGGRVVQFTGDGVMAAFPAASQALRAARALADDARGLGVEIRAGVHAGEAYTVEDQLFGTCVTVAARVAAAAGPGELLDHRDRAGSRRGLGLLVPRRGQRRAQGARAAPPARGSLVEAQSSINSHVRVRRQRRGQHPADQRIALAAAARVEPVRHARVAVRDHDRPAPSALRAASWSFVHTCRWRYSYDSIHGFTSVMPQ